MDFYKFFIYAANESTQSDDATGALLTVYHRKVDGLRDFRIGEGDLGVCNTNSGVVDLSSRCWIVFDSGFLPLQISVSFGPREELSGYITHNLVTPPPSHICSHICSNAYHASPNMNTHTSTNTKAQKGNLPTLDLNLRFQQLLLSKEAPLPENRGRALLRTQILHCVAMNPTTTMIVLACIFE
jgi:hypothetical protein